MDFMIDVASAVLYCSKRCGTFAFGRPLGVYTRQK